MSVEADLMAMRIAQLEADCAMPIEDVIREAEREGVEEFYESRSVTRRRQAVAGWTVIVSSWLLMCVIITSAFGIVAVGFLGVPRWTALFVPAPLTALFWVTGKIMRRFDLCGLE